MIIYLIQIMRYKLTKFHIDVSWNIISLAMIGISGITLNIIISYYYNASVLGVFNQVYAAYIFFSQFAVGGVHLSTLKHVSEYSNNKNIYSTIIFSALLITIILSFLFSGIFFLSSNIIGNILESKSVSKGILWSTPGLFFFAINKVMLFVLNGFRNMRKFAICQTLRYFFIIISLFIVILLEFPGDKLAIIFSIGEFLLFIILFSIVKKHFSFNFSNESLLWIKKHFSFGTQSFFSGVLIELNTRVDVLMIGYFSSDKMVGIYSFAAMLAEGISQLPVVIRTNFNPIIVKNIISNNLIQLKKLASKIKFYTYFIMFIICLIAIFIYPYGIKLMTNKQIFTQSWLPFSILLIGIFISSGFIPLNQIFLQAGKPALHTFMISLVVIFNIVFNYFLIPNYGISGAASATSLSFVFSIVILYYLSYKVLNFKI